MVASLPVRTGQWAMRTVGAGCAALSRCVPITGVWRSGSASARHAEGRWFEPTHAHRLVRQAKRVPLRSARNPKGETCISVLARSLSSSSSSCSSGFSEQAVRGVTQPEECRPSKSDARVRIPSPRLPTSKPCSRRWRSAGSNPGGGAVSTSRECSRDCGSGHVTIAQFGRAQASQA